ncbi:MAG TPA: DUF6531 domain-containing protein, partial [Chloroflexota bacterium]|nr:DUF6531 domain-containing protein [Chloroflexota bacterium]
MIDDRQAIEVSRISAARHRALPAIALVLLSLPLGHVGGLVHSSPLAISPPLHLHPIWPRVAPPGSGGLGSMDLFLGERRTSGATPSHRDSTAGYYSIAPVTGPPGFTDVTAAALSQQGHVVGNGTNACTDCPTPQDEAFIWRGSSSSALGPISYSHYSDWLSIAGAINAKDDVVGVAADGQKSVLEPVEWDGGSGTPSRTLPLPSNCTGLDGYAINDGGDIVEFAVGPPASGCQSGTYFLSNGGSPTAIGVPGFAASSFEPVAINDKDQVLLVYQLSEESGYLWQNGSATTLPAMDFANALNDEGVVAGQAYDLPAYSYQGITVPLYAPPPFDSGWSQATGLNNACDIVGYLSPGGGQDTLKNRLAVIWPNAGMPIALQSLLPPSSGVSLKLALDINDNGQILVEGTDAKGQDGYWLLTPPIGATPALPPAGQTGCEGFWSGSEGFGHSNPATSAPASNESGYGVNDATGNFSETEVDAVVPGRGRALLLSRTYNSQAVLDKIIAARASVPDQFGNGWSSSYGAYLLINGSGATVCQEDGATVSFVGTASGYQAAPFVTAKLVKTKSGSYVFTKQDGAADTFDAVGRLIAESDRNGYITTLKYDKYGHLASVTDPAGRSLNFTSDSAGRITGITDPAGRAEHYDYDAAGDLVRFTNFAGQTTTYSYDSLERMTSRVLPNSATLHITYDSQNRVTAQTDPIGRATAWMYYGLPPYTATAVQSPAGNWKVEKFADNLMLYKTDGYGTPDQATWSYSYNQNLGVSSTTDPNGHTWTNVHNTDGNLVSSTDPLGRTSKYTYNAFDELTSATDPSGVTTTYTYDARGNMLRASRPTGNGHSAIEQWVYSDPSHPGDAIEFIDADGNKWLRTYDAYGDLVETIDPLGDRSTSTFDILGQKTSSVAPDGNAPGANAAAFTTRYTYNALGEQLTVTNPLGHVETRTYDVAGNLTSVTNAQGRSTNFTYDLDNERISSTMPDGSTRKTGYDADGHVISQTDPAGHVTRYTYDPLGRLSSRIDPLGHTTTAT